MKNTATLTRCILALALILAPGSLSAQGGAVQVSIPAINSHRGDRVEIPVVLSGAIGQAVVAAKLEIDYDPAVLTFEEVVTEGTLTAGWMVQHNIRTAGDKQQLHVGLAAAAGFATAGDLFLLAFRVSESVALSSGCDLELITAALEQASDGALLDVELLDGSLRVRGQPVIWSNAVLALDEGNVGALDPAVLDVRDPDNTAAELLYTVATAPLHGTLRKGSQVLVQASTFTQEDINQGTVQYIHDGSETSEDDFTFAVTDGIGDPLQGSLLIEVAAVNDVPALEPLGNLTVDENTVVEVAVATVDPDGTPILAVSNLPPFASFEDRGDGTGTLSLSPNFTHAGVYLGLEITATDEFDASLVDSEIFTLVVNNINNAPVAAAGQDIEVAYVAVAATAVTLDGSGSSDPENDPLIYRWFANGVQIATGATATVDLPFGSQTVSLVVDDGALLSQPDEVVVDVVDRTPPIISLLGDEELLLELGTPYDEPGGTAQDEIDGDLSANVEIIGSVDENAEGEYVLTYQVSDAAGNAAVSQTRTIEVVTTANSYVLIATHSMYLKSRARIHTGHIGVVDFGSSPFVGGREELVMGSRASTGAEVQVSAPRVLLRGRVDIAGTLVFSELRWFRPTPTIGEQQKVGGDYWPLFDAIGLPAFQIGDSGTVDIDVRQRNTLTLLPEQRYDRIRVRSMATLILAGGEYHIDRLDIGQNATVVALAPVTLLIGASFDMRQKAYFGPQDNDVDPAAIRVYVNGTERRRNDERDAQVRYVSKAARVGVKAQFAGNLYAPNGTIDLRESSQTLGSFIARDVIVGTRAEVSLRSGWEMPGVIYQPPTGAVAKPIVRAMEEEQVVAEVQLGNYPNPFNPSTTLRYSLPEFAQVQLTIYSALGQKVSVLVDESQAAGAYTVEWDGRDTNGIALASGVYLAHLRVGKMQQSQKLILMK